MDTIKCGKCDVTLEDSAFFCFSCGAKVKCKSCGSMLTENARFCSHCGANVTETKSNMDHGINKLTYRRTNEGVFCEVTLTDEVGKLGITGILNNLNGNKPVDYTLIGQGAEINFSDTDGARTEENEEEKISESSGTSRDSGSLPHLNDVQMNVNCSEAEWIAIYAFYESNFNTKTFSKENVYKRYVSSRGTVQRKKNFSSNWQGLFKHYFCTVTDNSFKFKPEKLSYLKNLIRGNEKGMAKSQPKKTIAKSKISIKDDVADAEIKNEQTKAVKKKKKGNALPSVVKDLNLYPKDSVSLKDFYSGFDPKNNKEQNLIFVYYLSQTVKVIAISVDHIFTCYRDVNIAVPESLDQSLRNTSFHKGWINTADINNVTLTTPGLNYLEQTMAKRTKV